MIILLVKFSLTSIFRFYFSFLNVMLFRQRSATENSFALQSKSPPGEKGVGFLKYLSLY